MATIQERNTAFRILFVFQGKRRTINLGKVRKDEAEAKSGQVDLLLLRLKQGLLSLPAAVSIEEFLLRDGQVKTEAEAAALEPKRRRPETRLRRRAK